MLMSVVKGELSPADAAAAEKEVNRISAKWK